MCKYCDDEGVPKDEQKKIGHVRFISIFGDGMTRLYPDNLIQKIGIPTEIMVDDIPNAERLIDKAIETGHYAKP